MAKAFALAPYGLVLLDQLTSTAGMAQSRPFAVDLWEAQNFCHIVLSGMYTGYRRRASQGDAEAQAWVARFRELGRLLRFKID